MLSAPFALVGGVFLQWRLGFSMTTAVIIGYVSLFAVAIQTGIIMIEFIREALANRTPEQSYMDAVVEGSVARLRPKLMTVATTVLGSAADHVRQRVGHGHHASRSPRRRSAA